MKFWGRLGWIVFAALFTYGITAASLFFSTLSIKTGNDGWAWLVILMFGGSLLFLWVGLRDRKSPDFIDLVALLVPVSVALVTGGFLGGENVLEAAVIVAFLSCGYLAGIGSWLRGRLQGTGYGFIYVEQRFVPRGNREGQDRAQSPRLEEEPEEIDWPQWEAAPPEAPALSHEEKLSRYTRENGLKAVQRANVNPDRAASTAHARHLIRYCEHVLGGRARGFIASAAKDTGLPENVRRLYIHAAQIAGRE